MPQIHPRVAPFRGFDVLNSGRVDLERVLDNNLDDGDKVRDDAGDGALGGEYSVGGCRTASLGAGRSSGGDIEAGFAGGLILTGSGGAV